MNDQKFDITPQVRITWIHREGLAWSDWIATALSMMEFWQRIIRVQNRLFASS